MFATVYWLLRLGHCSLKLGATSSTGQTPQWPLPGTTTMRALQSLDNHTPIPRSQQSTAQGGRAPPPLPGSRTPQVPSIWMRGPTVGPCTPPPGPTIHQSDQSTHRPGSPGEPTTLNTLPAQCGGEEWRYWRTYWSTLIITPVHKTHTRVPTAQSSPDTHIHTSLLKVLPCILVSFINYWDGDSSCDINYHSCNTVCYFESKSFGPSKDQRLSSLIFSWCPSSLCMSRTAVPCVLVWFSPDYSFGCILNVNFPLSYWLLGKNQWFDLIPGQTAAKAFLI